MILGGLGVWEVVHMFFEGVVNMKLRVRGLRCSDWCQYDSEGESRTVLKIFMRLYIGS